MKRRAARIDRNQPDIVRALRSLPGISVAVTSAVGDGFPDIVVGYKGKSFLFEIKDPEQPPAKRRLTQDELVFHERWQGHIDVALTDLDILRQIGYFRRHGQPGPEK